MVETKSDAPKVSGRQTFDSVKVAQVFGAQGREGKQGERGETGPQGATYFPILNGSTLSWTNNDGLPNPEPVDIKSIIAVGAKGEQGIQGKDGKQGKAGPRGLTGKDGTDGKSGADGKDGKDGADGATFTPLYDEKTGLLSWVNNKGLENPQPILIKGKDGKAGKDGKHGLGGANAVINGYSTIEIKAGDGIVLTQKKDKMIIAADLSGKVNEAPKDGKIYGRQDGAWVDDLLTKSGGEIDGSLLISGTIQASNLSGTNTGDQDLSNLVEKETGKGLSTNDYTDADKERLADTSGTNTGDQDLSGLLPKSGGAMTGVLTYASPQVLNMQPVDTEPDVGDMVEGCIYFVAEDV